MAYQNLKAEMARIGVNMSDVAKVAGVSPRTVQNWMSSTSRPDVEQAKKIKQELFPSCTVDYLFGG